MDDQDEIQPRTRPLHKVDKYGPKIVHKAESLEARVPGLDERSDEESPGGFDSTPLPYSPPGKSTTVLIFFFENNMFRY